jgi:hypothetical protein
MAFPQSAKWLQDEAFLGVIPGQNLGTDINFVLQTKGQIY